ncbi:hypothetical protein BGZ51_001079 [Haplosporangium sp. Z 767]|nr:hypothetical protein BGZ51_001079 [Haplosporangium sp. Z 767]
MNRDRDPTQVIGHPIITTSSIISTSPSSLPSPPMTTTPAEEASVAAGLSKIQATALLLKQKVAGNSSKPQKLPNKISHPWSLSTSGTSVRSSSFPSPTSSSPSPTTTMARSRRESIKAMIAAREDPALSCNKMAPLGIQPIPAPQKRDSRAAPSSLSGMTKVQLSPSPQQSRTSLPSIQTTHKQEQGHEQRDHRSRGKEDRGDQEASRNSQEGVKQELNSLEECAQGPVHTTDSDKRTATGCETDRTDTEKRPARRRNGRETLVPSQFAAPSSTSPSMPAFMRAFEDPSLSDTTMATGATTTKTLQQHQQPLSPITGRPMMSPRRHTTSSSSSSSSFFSVRKGSPPVPLFPPQQQQAMSVVNPSLRQQTPKVPANLVQARILQQEEQKRRDEELAKIPITANLRTVKKIQAVLISDDEDDDKGGPSRRSRSKDESSSTSSSASSSPDATRATRPRSKTATSSSVTVSLLTGGKQRGDRNHVGPVAIPKKLADQVESILGRKLAGKGNLLDEREMEREEEEARKAAEPLPPIVLGKPRKRAMTSAHIRNLVSSWDHKVEEARETTTEAERIRQFLEERSTAHAELPKPKVPVTASELLRPLPSLPPPPPTTEIHLGSINKSGTSPRGRSRAYSNHVKGSSSLPVYSTPKYDAQTMAPSASAAAAAAEEEKKKQEAKVKVEEKSISTGENSEDAGYVSGPELKETEISEVDMETTPSTSEAVTEETKEDDTQVKGLETSTSQLSISTEVLDTKRSGKILVNKAFTSRPRRTGVRNPTKSTV